MALLRHGHNCRVPAGRDEIEKRPVGNQGGNVRGGIAVRLDEWGHVPLEVLRIGKRGYLKPEAFGSAEVGGRRHLVRSRRAGR